MDDAGATDQKTAVLTIRCYADDLLVKESRDERLWAYVFDKVVAAEQAKVRNDAHE